jgi:hypothetical protein
MLSTQHVQKGSLLCDNCGYEQAGHEATCSECGVPLRYVSSVKTRYAWSPWSIAVLAIWACAVGVHDVVGSAAVKMVARSIGARHGGPTRAALEVWRDAAKESRFTLAMSVIILIVTGLLIWNAKCRTNMIYAVFLSLHAVIIICSVIVPTIRLILGML